jgi:pyruvate,water dikinase
LTGNILWIDDEACHDIAVSGGKGASLARMTGAGLPVPAGFVVTATSLRASLAARGALAEVESLLSEIVQGDDGAAGERLRRIVLETPPSGELAAEISEAYQRLGESSAVAVRSSACAEDGEAASFAGQQETFLNVVGVEEVLEKVTECWASFFSERAMFYRRNKGSMRDLDMAVVVQRQLGSDKSGVMFTADPIRRRRDQMVIEAAWGLGESLVSGMVTPDNYVVRRDGSLKTVRVGRQELMITRHETRGTVAVELDDAKATARVLTDDEITRLAAVGRELEGAFGGPQDIEWAYVGDDLFVLQSRPITT